ncbi:MAG: hypothetical protein HIU57_04235 [Acidobacteria bacterium]|nr:hypothetical protein [Acidobacteriota bacterium]
MRLRRTTLVANVVIIGATIPAVALPTAAPIGTAAPMYEYVNAGPTTWSTKPVSDLFGGHRLLGDVHAVSGDGEFALAARIDNGDVGLYVRNANGTNSFRDITSLTGAPAAATDPNIFLDPWGNVGLIYVSARNRLIMVSTAAARSSRHANLATRANAFGFTVTNLTTATHVPMSPSVPAITVSGTTALVVDRSTKGAAVTIPVRWLQESIAPLIGTATNVSAATNTATLMNDPVTFSSTTSAFAATTVTGHVEYFAQSATGVWGATDLTNLDASPVSTGPLVAAANGLNLYLASLDGIGHVQLFSAPAAYATPLARLTPRVAPHAVSHAGKVAKVSPSWTYSDVTKLIVGSPSWEGQIYLSASATTINLAGRAANWGDLYDYTSVLAKSTWTSSDVSLDSGATNSVAAGVTGVLDGSTLRLFAASAGVITQGGVGVYAIPAQDWSRAIADGWPIISETGGLGTLNAPWVGFSTAKSLTQSPDFLMGQTLARANRRETWLSFWTVSGPLTPSAQTTASYYSHGFLAGQWVAQQIDQYHLHGVDVKPNWVILDPEGFPDNHSALDAPAGSSPAVIAKHASYWSAMLDGWASGLTNVDPTLHPGFYASQTEYRNYGLANSSLPAFEAIAFGNGGPIRIGGSNGSNILGYIAFNGTCSPPSALRTQEQTLLNPPWAGRFNTLQFNSGVYCAP